MVSLNNCKACWDSLFSHYVQGAALSMWQVVPVEWTFTTFPRWRHWCSGGKCQPQCHTASTYGESRLRLDPKDWVFFFLEYEFTEPKNFEDLKCHLVAIFINCRHNIPNVIKSHSEIFWQLQPIPMIENIYCKRLTYTVYHSTLCVDTKGFILSLEIYYAQISQKNSFFFQEQNRN